MELSEFSLGDEIGLKLSDRILLGIITRKTKKGRVTISMESGDKHYFDKDGRPFHALPDYEDRKVTFLDAVEARRRLKLQETLDEEGLLTRSIASKLATVRRVPLSDRVVKLLHELKAELNI